MNKIINISNFLSILRLFSGIPLVICLRFMDESPQYLYWSISIILFIVISDILDGYLARKYNSVTSFGKIIDPVSDKICLMFILIYLIEIYPLRFLLFFMLLSIRDIILITFTSYLAIYHDTVTQANTYGKMFIFVTMLMIISYIFMFNNSISNILYIMSVILLIISMFIYIKAHIETINSYENL